MAGRKPTKSTVTDVDRAGGGGFRVRTARGLLVTMLCIAVGRVGIGHAQEPEDECDPSLFRGPTEITPAFDSINVPLNAAVRVRYSDDYFALTGADPQASFVLLRCGSAEDLANCLTNGVPVSGRSSLVLDSLLFEPASLLEPGVQYLAVAEGVDDDFEAPFRTTNLRADRGGVDVQAPRLSRITGFSATEIDPSCEAPDGGFRVDVTLPPADGEVAGGDVEYFLYLTRGPGIEEPELRARVRGVPNEIVMAFVLRPEEVAGPICVTVQAVDAAGNLGEVPEPRCEDPIQGNFFEPLCGVGGSEVRDWPRWPALLFAVFAWLAWRNRRVKCAKPLKLR